LWRAARRDPWWYCNSGDCRFDLAPPRGTCYLGTDEITGILESIGPELSSGVIASSYLEDRRLYALELSSPLRLADLASRRAIGSGVTDELSTMVPYKIPQAWARKFDETGFEGIRYRTRFDTGERPRGIARFGASGPAKGATRAGKGAAGGSRQIDESLRRRLEAECGVTVAGMPALGELEIAKEP
jgi:RES domain